MSHSMSQHGSLAPVAAHTLRETLSSLVRSSSSGYPYLHQAAWVRFRDWVPHTLADGPRVLAAVDELLGDDDGASIDTAAGQRSGNAAAAARVVRQVVQTASVTAPPDLWLMRAVVAALQETGLAERFLADEVVVPAETPFLAHELLVDLRFLLSRGTLVRASGGFRLSDTVAAREVMALGPISAPVESGTDAWLKILRGDVSDRDATDAVTAGAMAPLPSSTREPGHFHPSAADVELGYRLVPLVIAAHLHRIETGATKPYGDVRPEGATAILAAAGLVDDQSSLTALGERVHQRGPGPFGIIEAYRGYMGQLPQMWRDGRGQIWVERTANVAASQVANAKTFATANDALDAFCADTGFAYDVFVEHAVGRGEATRQRHARSGDALRYVGADLEDAAIDAAIVEQKAGNLPASMHFVRNADIGKPRTLLAGLGTAGLNPEGAVMLVGNGFHEVRHQSDETMTEVFRGYERAGILVIFTEETALAVDDLLATAWNTYHAGFKYVHERSGQGLRPAEARPPSALEGPLPRSWTECAEAAGYVRAEKWCRRGRTVYPYPPPSGHNPCISVNHFFIPARIAAKLGIKAPS